MMWEPRDSVRDSFVARGPYPCSVAAVMEESGAEVPGIEGVWGPGLSVGRFVMD